MRFGNCLIFAILMRLALGGRIASRKSAYGWWRHYWWESPCGRVRAEFNPPAKRRRWLPPPIFRGAVTVIAREFDAKRPKYAPNCEWLSQAVDFTHSAREFESHSLRH